jgi:hypothetical protein
MKTVLRLAWVFGCAWLGWYVCRGVPEEAWWGTAAGGLFGLLSSPEALGRTALIVGCAVGLALFAHQVVGTPGEYWPFFLMAGAMIGQTLRLDLVAAAVVWFGHKTLKRRAVKEGKPQ